MDMGMSIDSMSGGETSTNGMMKMAFKTSYQGVPILFESWAPTSAIAFVGSIVAIFAAAVCMQGLIYAKHLLHAKRWVLPFSLEGDAPVPPSRSIWIAVEVQRILLAFILAVLGYSLMLVAMTYVVAYFLAICTGLAVGELLFGRSLQNLKYVGLESGESHCVAA